MAQKDIELIPNIVAYDDVKKSVKRLCMAALLATAICEWLQPLPLVRLVMTYLKAIAPL